MTTDKTRGSELTTTDKKEYDMSKGEPTFEGRFFSFDADIIENENAVTVIADMPGVSAEGLDIDLRDNVLTIRGNVENIPGNWRVMHTDYEIGHFMRQFQISSSVDQEKINAKIQDGVLTLVLPKAERLRPRKINIVTA